MERSLADPGVVLHLVQHISPSILFPVSRKWPNARDCLEEALIFEDRAVASPTNERELFLRERQAHVHAGFRHLVQMQEEMEIQHGYCRVSHSIRGKARKRGGCRARPQRSVGSNPGGA